MPEAQTAEMSGWRLNALEAWPWLSLLGWPSPAGPPQSSSPESVSAPTTTEPCCCPRTGPSQMHSRPPRVAPHASVTRRGRANACRPHPLVTSGAPTRSSLTWLLPAPQKVICPHCRSPPALGSTWVSHPQIVPCSAAVSMLTSKGHIADLFL